MRSAPEDEKFVAYFLLDFSVDELTQHEDEGVVEPFGAMLVEALCIRMRCDMPARLSC